MYVPAVIKTLKVKCNKKEWFNKSISILSNEPAYEELATTIMGVFLAICSSVLYQRGLHCKNEGVTATPKSGVKCLCT